MNTAVNYTFCILNIQQNANETYPEHTHIHTGKERGVEKKWRNIQLISKLYTAVEHICQPLLGRIYCSLARIYWIWMLICSHFIGEIRAYRQIRFIFPSGLWLPTQNHNIHINIYIWYCFKIIQFKLKMQRFALYYSQAHGSKFYTGSHTHTHKHQF